MGGAWKLSALLAAALCAALLAACGGGDGDSTATTATQTTAEATSEQEQGGDNGSGSGGAKGSKGNGSGSGGSSSNANGGGGSSNSGGGQGSKGDKGGGGSVGVADAKFNFSGEPTKHKHPKPEEGQRSDVFLVPGGDNSIQEYGEEQGEEERVAAMLPITALYKAQFTGNWSEVCDTYLSSNNLQQLKLLGEKSPQLKGKDCAETLGGLTQQGAGLRTPDTPDGGVVSFRVDGDTGFAIYWGIDGKGYAFALKSEGGWKLTSLAPTPLQVG